VVIQPTVGRISSEATQWILIVRGAYLEIPALQLTRSQVQRLWGLDVRSCDSVLHALLEQRFLEQTQGGAFVRAAGARP
jgi:hypothetical protein